MGKQKGLRAGSLAGLVAGLVLLAGSADARVSTERPASILIFPKVINIAGGQDTLIQITNTSNLPRFARCFYVDGSPDGNGFPRWQVTDFNLVLTRQQPTHFIAGQGRPVNPADDIEGLDPGPVPPVPPGFTGELVCVQVDESGVPEGGDSLKGDATIGGIAGGGVSSEYNAVGIPAGTMGPDNGVLTANELLLDNVEYSGCPAGFHLNFAAENSTDPVIEGLGNGTSNVSTNLTIVPCSMDFESAQPSSVTLAFEIRDEFEGVLSSSTTVQCWASFTLGDFLGSSISSPTFTNFGYAQVTATAPVGGNAEGVLAVANVQRSDGNGNISTAATNLHFFGNTDTTNIDTSVIRLSEQ